MSKTIGVLGGMGPYATLDFMYKLLRLTDVEVEQDHLRVLIYNNPKIPSRIEALENGSASPLPALVATAHALERGGVDFITMPCHSAHYWLEPLQQAISVPVISMIDCATGYFARQHDPGSVLILASATTLRSGQYQSAFEALNIKLVLPDANEQSVIHAAIQAIKLERHHEPGSLHELQMLLQRYKERGVNRVLGACTEFPLIENQLDPQLTFVDPTLLLAQKAVELAQG